MHFFVLTVIIFCVFGAYSLSGEMQNATWLKAAATHIHKYMGFPTYRGSTRANKSSLLCPLLQERDSKRQRIIGAMGLLSSPLTEAEQAITSYCTI